MFRQETDNILKSLSSNLCRGKTNRTYIFLKAQAQILFSHIVYVCFYQNSSQVPRIWHRTIDPLILDKDRLFLDVKQQLRPRHRIILGLQIKFRQSFC